MHIRSNCTGLTNMTASSAYIDSRCKDETPGIPLRVSWPSGWVIRAVSASMARTNSRGDRGSPCLNPLTSYILLPETPLTTILELEMWLKEVNRSKYHWTLLRGEPQKGITRRGNQMFWICQVLAAHLAICGGWFFWPLAKQGGNCHANSAL